ALDEAAHAGEVLVLDRGLHEVDDRAHGGQVDAGHAVGQLLTDPGTDQLLEVVGCCGAAGLPHALEPLRQQPGGDGRGGTRIVVSGDGDVVHGSSWLAGPCTRSWQARDAGPLRPAPPHSTGNVADGPR